MKFKTKPGRAQTMTKTNEFFEIFTNLALVLVLVSAVAFS